MSGSYSSIFNAEVRRSSKWLERLTLILSDGDLCKGRVSWRDLSLCQLPPYTRLLEEFVVVVEKCCFLVRLFLVPICTRERVLIFGVCACGMSSQVIDLD